MAFLNHNTPILKAKIKLEFLYNKEKHFGGEDDCIIHSVTTIEGKTPLFNILLPNGAFYARLPINAFFSANYKRSDVKDVELKDIAYWDCLSYYAGVVEYNVLNTAQCKFLSRDNKLHEATYKFTIDYAQPDINLLNTTYCEISQEHKHHHLLEIKRGDDWQGNFAIMPNNRILFNLPNFTVRNEIPDYKVNMNYPSVETDSWRTSDNDSLFYTTKEEN
jgi:hypothetical protein